VNASLMRGIAADGFENTLRSIAPAVYAGVAFRFDPATITLDGDDEEVVEVEENEGDEEAAA
jgi:hypothetical protein